MPMVHGTGLWWRSMSLRHSELILAVDQAMEDSDIITWNVIYRSNRDRSSWLRRPTTVLPPSDYVPRKQNQGPPWPDLERAQARAVVDHFGHRLLLQKCKDVRNLLCFPRGSGGLRWGLAMTTSFPRPWSMVWAASGGSTSTAAWFGCFQGVIGVSIYRGFDLIL
jgi:hypothetical protein